MSVAVWDGVGAVLADTSAWTQARRDARARKLLVGAIERGVLHWCWPVRYELMIDARGQDDIAAVERSLEGLREIPVDRSVQRAVFSAMREMAASGSHGSHRFPLADLAVAAAAQAAGVEILHFDRHFERLSAQFGVAAYWISPPV
ncbi:MAG TPA: PIN domain-containing protein [Solirubrobacterales bacterium]|nr:PIN domain-containing protein [Solirubrobacterales bacterium]